MGLICNNSPYYFQKNIQGDIIRICNAGGDTVVEYTYDAWGKALSVTESNNTTQNKRRFPQNGTSVFLNSLISQGFF